MFDRDLAKLYGVEPKVLNQAVKRNAERFPDDFMFKLSREEMFIWKSQIVTSKGDVKGLRKPPSLFTEQGVAMLSSILNSKRAIEVNVQIIRTFVKLREMIISNKELRIRIEEMERKYDKRFKAVFDTLRSLVENNKKEEKIDVIGFKAKK